VAATTISFNVSEWWHLPHADLVVWTTHMVISSHTHSTSQKGSGRIVGRVGDDAERTAPGEAVPPLAEVAKTRPVSHLEEVSGTLAEFHFPDFTRG
jgi:hypothetical protein